MKREVYFHVDETSELSLNYCGTEICRNDFFMPPHIRKQFLIHYVLSGKGTFHTPQKEYALQAGDLFLIYPNTPVSYETEPSAPFHFSWFSFSGSKAEETAQILGFRPSDCVKRLHLRFSIHEKILECIDGTERGNAPGEFFTKEKLYGILRLIHASCMADEGDEEKRRPIMEQHVQKSISFMKMNYMNPIGVGDAAAFVGLERTYFSKIFHQQTGMTPQNFLLQVRIDQARQLLRRTDYPIGEISSFVGFADECYFSRAFRKKTGLSPKQFRQDKETKRY